MTPHRNRPGLLVSVRNAREALAALAGGADVIDVKEPARGSLGAADRSTIADVVRAVAGQAPVTAALGELTDVTSNGAQVTERRIPTGVSLFKIGLAGCQGNARWPALWREVIDSISARTLPRTQPVAVVYADWRTAAAPEPNDVLRAAIEFGCPALLVDTFDKSRGSAFKHWRLEELAAFVGEVRSRGIAPVLAGSIGLHEISTAVRLAPDLVAVRTAACDAGRNGTVTSQRVRELQLALHAAAAEHTASHSPRLRL